jgi:lysophospholipase L1-like esterase
MLQTRLLTLVLFAISLSSAWIAQADDAPAHSAVTPVPRDANWMKRHEKLNERAKQGDVDLVFIGDSITEGWEGAGREVWQQHYGNRKAMNLGIGGDRTQHVLWRLDNGNIEGIKPKLAVIMIGTNNSNGNDNSAEEISDGIKSIVAKLRDRLPEMKILLLGVFPRGEKHNPQREKISTTNEIARQVADGKMVRYLDIKEKFLNEDGSLSKDIMPDYLHLSPKGYEIWASSIEDRVAELLGEK